MTTGEVLFGIAIGSISTIFGALFISKIETRHKFKSGLLAIKSEIAEALLRIDPVVSQIDSELASLEVGGKELLTGSVILTVAQSKSFPWRFLQKLSGDSINAFISSGLLVECSDGLSKSILNGKRIIVDFNNSAKLAESYFNIISNGMSALDPDTKGFMDIYCRTWAVLHCIRVKNDLPTLFLEIDFELSDRLV